MSKAWIPGMDKGVNETAVDAARIFELGQGQHESPLVYRRLYSFNRLRSVLLAAGNHGVEGDEQFACCGDDGWLRTFPCPFQAFSKSFEVA